VVALLTAAWLVVTTVVLVWVLTRPAPDLLATSIVPTAALSVVAVAPAPEGLLVDGLLYVNGAAIGVPTTWLLDAGEDDALAAAVLDDWADDGREATVDLSGYASAHPWLTLRRDGVELPLVVLRPTPHGG
jgi:hypothetical protein